MYKKIYLISYGTGGAEIFNIIYPLMKKELKTHQIENIVISKFAKGKNSNSIFISENKIINYLDRSRPDIIINERSNGLYIQNLITEYCKTNNIFNICILDYFGNYESRFTSFPDIIVAPSLSTYNDLIEFGVDKDDLVIGGNPSFDRFENYVYNRNVNVEFPKILYTSQGPKFDYVFKEFHELVSGSFSDFDIDVKTHPQEDNGEWDEIIKGFKNTRILEFNNKEDFLSECLNYDLLVGYNSTLQLQAYLIGIPVIFYEMNNIEAAINNFKNRKFPLEIHPYGDFEKSATMKTLEILNRLIK